MWETWVAAHPMLKIAANMLYDNVSTDEELLWRIVQGKQPPKTDENDIATNKDPAACQILKCPNLSICHMKKTELWDEYTVTLNKDHFISISITLN